MFIKRLLNVGGNNKKIPIPDCYANYMHLILDIDPECKPDILCDARKMKTLIPRQFDAVYSSHNLEHFFAHEVGLVLEGMRHVLKPDGFVEIRVPNVLQLMQHVVENGLDMDSMLYKAPSGVPVLVRDVFYGWGHVIQTSGVDYFAHRTGFSKNTLVKAMHEAGFEYCEAFKTAPFELTVLGFLQTPNQEQMDMFQLEAV